MANHPEHICRFNDGEQSCDCYDEGFRQAAAGSNEKLVRVAERAVEEFKKEMREKIPKEKEFDDATLPFENSPEIFGGKRKEAYRGGFNSCRSQVLALLDSDEKA